MRYEFYVGSYAARDEDSIWKYALDTDTLSFSRIWSFRGAENPSYLLAHPDGKVLYSVEEVHPEGRVAAYVIGGGGLSRISLFPSGGADPCHLSMDDKAQFLFAANYSSGSVAVYRLDEDGKILEMTDLKQHTGSSVDPERQERAHCHCSAFYGGYLYVCDLGEDRIAVYGLDRASGKLQETDRSIAVPAGQGPRHLVFDEKTDTLCVITELGASLLTYEKVSSGRYELKQQIGALPEGVDPDTLETVAPRAIGAAIKRTKDGVAVSLRGLNAIAGFTLDENGGASLKGRSACGGKTPRDFAVFGESMVSANQDSDTLTLLRTIESGSNKEEDSTAPEAVEKIHCPVCVTPVESIRGRSLD